MTTAPAAAYDEIADWYEHEFLAGTAAPGADPLGIGAALGSLLGQGTGTCLEIGCGTGAIGAHRCPPVLLRRVRRPQRPRLRGDPPRLPGRPLDQGVLAHQRRPGQGRLHPPAPAQPHARFPGRRADD